jgi:hypothetical protein
MPIATKDGLLIVKDGKVAENCNCCGLTCFCDDGVTKLPQTISATLFVRFIDGFYGVDSDELAWRGTYSLNLVSCFRYLATIATPEPRNRFTGILAASTTTLRLDLSGETPGLFYILPDWLPEGPPSLDYLNGRWVVSGSIRSIICSGGSVKRFRLENSGYRFASVEISANQLP